jgi:hypothetical protein
VNAHRGRVGLRVIAIPPQASPIPDPIIIPAPIMTRANQSIKPQFDADSSVLVKHGDRLGCIDPQ